MGTHPIFESDFDCLTEMGGSESKSKKSQKSGYPTQSGTGYPTQSEKPAPQPQQYAPPPPQHYAQPQQYAQTPYAPPPQGYPGQSQQPAYPQAQPTSYGHAPPPNVHYQNGVQYAAMPNQFQPGQTVIVPGGFDNGARFKNGQANIPPPPPGCLPNAAQVASAQGATVQVSQDQRSKLVGDMGGGVTFW